MCFNIIAARIIVQLIKQACMTVLLQNYRNLLIARCTKNLLMTIQKDWGAVTWDDFNIRSVSQKIRAMKNWPFKKASLY